MSTVKVNKRICILKLYIREIDNYKLWQLSTTDNYQLHRSGKDAFSQKILIFFSFLNKKLLVLKRTISPRQTQKIHSKNTQRTNGHIAHLRLFVLSKFMVMILKTETYGYDRWSYIPNINGLGLLLSDKKIFQSFSLYVSIGQGHFIFYFFFISGLWFELSW